MDVSPELVKEAAQSIEQFVSSALVKGKEEQLYRVVITEFLPSMKLSQFFGKEIYIVKGVFLVLEEGGRVDYDSLAYLRKENIKKVLRFMVMLDTELKIKGFKIFE